VYYVVWVCVEKDESTGCMLCGHMDSDPGYVADGGGNAERLGPVQSEDSRVFEGVL